MEKEREGKLIVITGPDGCGKKTQTGMLGGRLIREGYDIATLDFPQYEKNFFGKMVGRYLKGEFGNAAEINPYLVSILYAGDRFESMRRIKQWLAEGKIIVCDRYVGDNFLHQGSKIEKHSEREKFSQWLENLEFNVFGAQRADITFYLDVSLEVSLGLLNNRGTKKDGHENKKHLMAVRKISEELIQRYSWTKIDCMKGDKIMLQEEIHQIIWAHLNSMPKPF